LDLLTFPWVISGRGVWVRLGWAWPWRWGLRRLLGSSAAARASAAADGLPTSRQNSDEMDSLIGKGNAKADLRSMFNAPYTCSPGSPPDHNRDCYLYHEMWFPRPPGWFRWRFTPAAT